MADYNAVMAQLQAQARDDAAARVMGMVNAGQIVTLTDEEGRAVGYWNPATEQSVGPDQFLGDALIPLVQQYVMQNPGDPAAQQMQADLQRAQADAHKGDFGSLLHGLAVSAAAGGAMSGAFGGGSILGGLPPAGGEMLGEGVFGPPAPGGSFFVGPPTPAAPTPILGEGLMGPPVPGGEFFTGPPTPAAPTPILGEGLMGPPAPGGDFFTGPPTPTLPATPGAAPAQLPGIQNLPGTNSPVLPTVPGTTTAIPPGMTAAEAATAAGAAAGAAGGGASGGSSLGSWLRSQGLDISDDALKLMGSGASTLLGLYGANQQTNTLKDLADREMSIRQPFIDATKSMMADPGSYYKSAPAQGATDAVLRKLSVNGNPIGNPGDLSKAAAYNLGGYNESLRTLGGLAMGSAGTTVNLGKDIAASQGSGLNAIGSTIADLTNPKEDTLAKLARLMGRNTSTGLY